MNHSLDACGEHWLKFKDQNVPGLEVNLQLPGHHPLETHYDLVDEEPQ
jgi:hypothetical protein